MDTTSRPEGQREQSARAQRENSPAPWTIGSTGPNRLVQKIYVPIKSAVDWLAALAMFIVCLPLLGALVLAVKLTSPGPAFYSQRRVGKGGKIYKIFKLRTMVNNAEKGSGAVWSKPGDSRITPVGKWLRNTHLDEIPQLLNILSGNMSLIGPRPERPEITPELERRYPRYSQRHNVKPGVTGLAQMLHPADTDISSVRKKLAFDLYYVDRVSPMLDLRISLSTFMYFLAEVAEIWSKLAVKRHGAHVEEILDHLQRNNMRGWEVDVETGIPSPNLVDRQAGRHATLHMDDAMMTTAADESKAESK